MLDKLYTLLIDEKLFKNVDNETLHELLLDIFDSSIINTRFQNMKQTELQTDFLQRLLSETPNNKQLDLKENELAKFILEQNMKLAIEILDEWFPIFVIKEKEWILQKMINKENLCFVHMQKILHFI